MKNKIKHLPLSTKLRQNRLKGVDIERLLDSEVYILTRAIRKLEKRIKEDQETIIYLVHSNPDLIKKIEQGFNDIKEGRFVTLEQLKIEIENKNTTG